MKSWRWLAMAAAAGVLAGCASGPQTRPAASPGNSAHLTRFQSDADLAAFLKLDERARARAQRMAALAQPLPPPPPPPVSTAPATKPGTNEVIVTGTFIRGAAEDAALPVEVTSRAELEKQSSPSVAELITTGTANPSITNTQEANVDEGGIVKVAGDYLVVLRRGRLHTISTAGGGLQAVDHIDAWPPGAAPGNYYDEMLVLGDRIIVIGLAFQRGGTEISRFRISPTGQLRYEDTYQIASDDYYSSDNYASRLVGTKLVFYSPHGLWNATSLDEVLPKVRHWRGVDDDKGFRRVVGGGGVYMAAALRNDPESAADTLHSVITCDLAAAVMDCSAIGVLGTSSRNFYVSSKAIYLWLTDERYGEDRKGNPPEASIYRLGFNGEPPQAVQARGAPLNQFSFREDAADGVLNVLVQSQGGGDAMWRSQFTEGKLALLRLPLSAFGDGGREAGKGTYRDLPHSEGGQGLTNRFVGRYLLYGYGDHWLGSGQTERKWIYAAPLSGGPVAVLPIPSDVGRIEVLGRDALAVGRGGEDTVFQTVELSTWRSPRLGDRFVYEKGSEGETRSHGFFYRSDTEDGASGVLGLPVTRPGRPGVNQLWEGSSAITFIRRQNRKLSGLGDLAAGDLSDDDDGCRASCADWYGNARPIFLRGRVYALMGYELVEGELAAGRITERRRVDFTPKK